jgi:hypothetical protein
MKLPRDYQVLTDSDSIDDVCVYAPSMKGKDHSLTVYVPGIDDPCDLERLAEEVARRLNVAPEPDANPAVTVTLSQAVAFVVAMVGHVDYGMGVEAPKSPHVVTHLDAVLGHGKTPNECLVDSWAQPAQPRPPWPVEDCKQMAPLIDYLHAVVHALQAHREALRP